MTKWYYVRQWDLWYYVRQWDYATRSYREVAKFLFESDAQEYVNRKIDTAERCGGGNIDFKCDFRY